MECEGEVGVIVSPIAGPEMEISSLVPSIGLVSITTTLNKEIEKKLDYSYCHQGMFTCRDICSVHYVTKAILKSFYLQ